MAKWTLFDDEIKHFIKLKKLFQQAGRPLVLWGWKRDKVVSGIRQPESRTVYFSADLYQQKNQIAIERAFFFLDTRARIDEISILKSKVGKTRKVGKHLLNIDVWPDKNFPGYARFRMVAGDPTKYDHLSVKRRLKGRPRITIDEPKLVPEHKSYNLSSLAPFVLCIGSGLSAESGLPLLGSIHNLFEVDNTESGELIFGVLDNLPERIASDVEFEFGNFCDFTIKAIKANPSDSHQLISKLYKKGIVKQVFTDNMDDILGKVGVPHIPTRLSIFPDRFPAQFDTNAKSLFVIGVAVDRRSVIKQARTKGLKVIAINPVLGVAPHSRNMDYLRVGDIFFKETANSALIKIIKESKFI